MKVSVISDLHLATYASKPQKVLKYLKSIQPEILVLNGDIIDSWRFSRNYFPKNHLKVIRQIIKMMEKEVMVYYITGNHDEFLRKFNHTRIGNLKIVNQLILDLNGRRTWILHGDIFDLVIHKSKWLAKLGSAAYGTLSIINKWINLFLHFLGKKDIMLYKKLKEKMTLKKTDLSRFEKTVYDIAIPQDYETVICGHTHKPRLKNIEVQNQRISYINCGDWVEHFTAAEYYDDQWHLFYHNNEDDETSTDEPEFPETKQLYQMLVKEVMHPNSIL